MPPTHGLLILEDDPYYFLQYPEAEEAKAGGVSSPAAARASPSLQWLDVDGRVLRFGSLSKVKVLSAGLRLGWATGPSPLMDRLELDMQATALHASGLSQVVAAGLFDPRGWRLARSTKERKRGRENAVEVVPRPERTKAQRANLLSRPTPVMLGLLSFPPLFRFADLQQATGVLSRGGGGGGGDPAGPGGLGGWEALVARVAGRYRAKRDAFLRAAQTHLGPGGGPGGPSPRSSAGSNAAAAPAAELAAALAEWAAPTAGMFCWLKLVGLEAAGVTDSADFVRSTLARDHKVLFAVRKRVVEGGQQ